MAGNGFLLGLFGSIDGATSLGPGGRISLFRDSVNNATRDTARLRKDPTVTRDLAKLDAAIAKAKTPADLFKDPNIVKTLLEGLGLADQAANVGLARQALLSKPSDPKSLAARLPDSRWKTAAQQLDFAASGLAKLKTQAVRDVIAGGVVENRRVGAIEKTSQAVADAIVIRNMKDGETPSVYNLLGNKVMRRVVQTIAGLPKELAVQSVEAQARQVNAHVKLTDFADAGKREKLIQRYLMLAEDNKTDDTTLESLVAKL
jgi:hypothetical protein